MHVVDNDSDHPTVHCLQLILIGEMRDFEMKVKAVTQGNEALDLIRKLRSFFVATLSVLVSKNRISLSYFIHYPHVAYISTYRMLVHALCMLTAKE